MAAEDVVLPTPPFPDVTTIMLAKAIFLLVIIDSKNCFKCTREEDEQQLLKCCVTIAHDVLERGYVS